MKLNDILKQLNGIHVSTDAIIVLLGLLLIIGIDRYCFPREHIDTTGLEKEIKAAKVSLDSVNALYNSAATARDMYVRKCNSLCPRVGEYEASEVRARKNSEWRQYRDSLSKYRDQATVQQIAREWAQLRVDTLQSKLDLIKMRSR